MSDNTHIEWTDATWNPITGCSVVSPGCTNCYAMKLAGTRLRNHPSRQGLTRDSAAGPVWNGQVRFNPQWLRQPLEWKRPRMIFVCAHGDLFHESVPDEWIDQVFAVMAQAPRHTFQVLTKRVERMRRYLAYRWRIDAIYAVWSGTSGSPCEMQSWPLPNVWVGASVEDQRSSDLRVDELRDCEAAVRWLSCEPLIAAVRPASLTDIHWMVVGGESGNGARPMRPDWARSLRDQCAAAGVPFFFKQWGQWSPGYAEHGNDLGYEDLVGARQHEWPDGTAAFAVGKKVSGRTLDGVEHSAYPEVAQ